MTRKTYICTAWKNSGCGCEKCRHQKWTTCEEAPCFVEVDDHDCEADDLDCLKYRMNYQYGNWSEFKK